MNPADNGRLVLDQVQEIIEVEAEIAASYERGLKREELWNWKRMGFSDSRIAALRGASEASIRQTREEYDGGMTPAE